MANEQQPKPQLKEFDGLYRVHSHFLTVQGEGPFSGDAAFFIRLRDCNIQCPLCDTDYTSTERAYDGTAAVLTMNAQFATRDTACDLVVITGGEPFRQDLTELVMALRAAGFRVQIETNGILAPSDAFKEYARKSPGIAIVVSPKTHYVDEWITQNAIAYKYVLTHGKISYLDGLPAEVLGRKTLGVARPPLGVPHVYVQPADEKDEAANTLNMQATVAACQQFGYRMQLQIHKYIEVE